MSSSFKRFLAVFLARRFYSCPKSPSGRAQESSQSEWDKTVELAKKEGRVVVSMPASHRVAHRHRKIL